MIYVIKDKELKLLCNNSLIKLPLDLQEKINNHFENIKNSGANVWNGEVLQIPGGGIDKTDIINEKIDIEKTILRETKEEVNIDLNDEKLILYNNISYLYMSEPGVQPGCEIFTKAKIKMTADEFKKHFEAYNTYLKENNLEIEFKKLYFLKKEKAIDELKKLNKPKRYYLIPLLQIDMEQE